MSAGIVVMETLGGFPNLLALWLRRAKPAFAYASQTAGAPPYVPSERACPPARRACLRFRQRLADMGSHRDANSQCVGPHLADRAVVTSSNQGYVAILRNDEGQSLPRLIGTELSR